MGMIKVLIVSQIKENFDRRKTQLIEQLFWLLVSKLMAFLLFYFDLKKFEY